MEGSIDKQSGIEKKEKETQIPISDATKNKTDALRTESVNPATFLGELQNQDPEEYIKKRTDWLAREYGEEAIKRIEKTSMDMEPSITDLQTRFDELEFSKEIHDHITLILDALSAKCPNPRIDENTGAIIGIVNIDPKARYLTRIAENGKWNILNPGREGIAVNVVELFNDMDFVDTCIAGTAPAEKDKKAFLEHLKQTMKEYGNGIDSQGNPQFGILAHPNMRRYEASRKESLPTKKIKHAMKTLLIMGVIGMAVVNAILAFISRKPPTAAIIYAGIAAYLIKPDILAPEHQKEAQILNTVANNQTLITYAKKYQMKGDDWEDIAKRIMENTDADIKNFFHPTVDERSSRDDLIYAIATGKIASPEDSQPLGKEHFESDIDKNLYDMIYGNDPDNPSSKDFRSWAVELQNLGREKNKRDLILQFIGRGYYMDRP